MEMDIIIQTFKHTEKLQKHLSTYHIDLTVMIVLLLFYLYLWEY